MGLDIRIPLGLIFLALGAIMTLYGLFTRHSAIYLMSEGINLNLIWGSMMLVFGAVIYLAAKRSAARSGNN